jgi:pyruvate formate lyase activating enzyme
MHEARYYLKASNDTLRCTLCPHDCYIAENHQGLCKVRKHMNQKLYTENYGMVGALGLDPMEKKPLYHYFPGSSILSIGTFGCNFNCPHCQNWEMAKACAVTTSALFVYTPEDILHLLQANYSGSLGLAYTYNEPVVFIEYMLDTAELLKQHGWKNVMVSNAYVYPEPLCDLLRVIDAFNIDIKSFDESVHRTYLHAELKWVLRNIQQIKHSGKHLEITFLIVPGVSDDFKVFKRMIQWILSDLGSDTILHLSRYFPGYLMQQAATPKSSLSLFYDYANQFLDYVYLGNVMELGGRDTCCPQCDRLCIRRSELRVSTPGIDEQGRCQHCGYPIVVID